MLPANVSKTENHVERWCLAANRARAAMKPPYNQKENTMDELSALAQEVRAMLKNRDSLPDADVRLLKEYLQQHDDVFHFTIYTLDAVFDSR